MKTIYLIIGSTSKAVVAWHPKAADRDHYLFLLNQGGSQYTAGEITVGEDYRRYEPAGITIPECYQKEFELFLRRL